MKCPNLTGVFSVVPTPFDAQGDVDIPSLRRAVDLYVGAGVDGLTTLGVTSEVSRLIDQERDLVLRTVVEQAAGRRSTPTPNRRSRVSSSG